MAWPNLSAGRRAGPSAEERTEKSTSVIQAKLTARSDLDFTELLWGFLKETGSFKDLQISIGGVFRALRTYVFQPTVHKGNGTTIGKIAKTVLSLQRGLFADGSGQAEATAALKEMQQSLVSPVMLVNSVVEIGAEKLRRDYSSHLIREELCT